MKYGAGILLACSQTGNILLALRNEPEVVWGNFGGMVEKLERSIQCAKREVLEETGFIEGVDYKLISKKPLDIGEYRNFVYRCYLGITEKELLPTLNFEHSKAKWFSLKELPENLHFGMIRIISNQKVIEKLLSIHKKQD